MLANCIFAAALILLGVVGYIGTRRVSVTALIPAFVGALVAVFALLAALSPGWASALRTATMVLAALGFVATARSLPAVFRVLGRKGGASPASVSKGMMSLSCLAFVGVVVFGG